MANETKRSRLLSPEEMDDRAAAAMERGFEWLRNHRQEALQPLQDHSTKPDGERR